VNEQQRAQAWRCVACIATAHVDALTGEGVIDVTVQETLRQAIAQTAGEPAPVGALLDLAIAFDDRVDTLASDRVTGVVRMGRGSAETVATMMRMVLRDEIARLADAADRVIQGLIEFAGAHVVTMVPIYAGSQPVQPSTLANVLGGVITPLGRALDQLALALEMVNQSPMGAAAGTSSRFAAGRGATAAALGFAGPAPNVFDAVSAVDYLTATGTAIEAVVSPVARLLSELESWLRAAPEVLAFAEEGLERLPDLPQLRNPAELDRLDVLALEARAAAEAARRWAEHAGLGPQLQLDAPLDNLSRAAAAAVALCDGMRMLVAGGMEVNRAAFGNRAGKGHITSADLIDFLVVEEQIAPGDARVIANRVLAQVKERGLEISGITREIVDAAGLLVIGREIGIEFERLSRYLAPRRFLESRTATGAPAPGATREWLAVEMQALAARRERFARLRAERPVSEPGDSL
jgi:argininosuccinate lyase